jgi:purine-binding chemotaxis protein CheW
MTALCIFGIGEHRFALDATRVQEVVQAATITAVPRAPGGVAGVVSLRGDILTAFDLRVSFGLPAAANSDASLVLRDDRETVSVLVDKVYDVVEVDAARREAIPTTLDVHARSVVIAAYQLDDELVLEVDASALVDLVAGGRRTETK